MNKMTRVSGTGMGSFQFHTTIKHGSGIREVAVEVSKEMIVELAAALSTFPCCAATGDNTSHAAWHVTMHEPVCRPVVDVVDTTASDIVVEDLGDDEVVKLRDNKKRRAAIVERASVPEKTPAPEKIYANADSEDE